MKTKIILGTAAAAALFAATIAVDFESAALSLTPTMEDKHRTNVTSAKAQVSTDAAKSGTRSLKIDVQFARQAYIMVPAADMTKSLVLEPGGTLSLAAMSMATNMWIKLRIVDAKGETYQMTRLTLNASRGTWLTKQWKLDETNAESVENIWGGSKDKKFDLPLKIDSIIIEGTGEGPVYIDDISFQKN